MLFVPDLCALVICETVILFTEQYIDLSCLQVCLDFVYLATGSAAAGFIREYI